MIVSILLFIPIFFLFFHDLILHITTNLYDWFDYPYYVWVIYQNIAKIKTLDFYHYFDTTAFYPHKMALLFSDILLPQALMALPLSFIIKNQILVFNLVFLAIFILDFICLFIFWKQCLKKGIPAFFGSLLTLFLLINLELGHFQMMFFWPFLLSLYFVFRNEDKYKVSDLILAGFFLAIQFLASVYISLFLIAALGIYFFASFLFSRKKISVIKNFILIFAVFLLIDGIFIKGYFDMKKNYQIQRSINEYIGYSVHLTDYLFVKDKGSLLYSTGLFKKWNQLDKHIGIKAYFPGFLITLLAFIGLFSLTKKKDSFSIKLNLDKTRLFFLLLLITGFVFSLGPRISFNGNYAHLPTPYAFFLKFIPLFESVRAPGRWSYLFYIGVVFFAMIPLASVSTKKRIVLSGLIFFLILAEYLPFPIKTHQEAFLSKDDEILKNICSKEKKVLLEIPVTHYNVKGGTVKGLNYITKVELASDFHNCYLINGYSGYDLPELVTIDVNLNDCLEKNNCDQIRNQLSTMRIDVIKFNENEIRVPVPMDFQKKLSISKMPFPNSSDLYLLNREINLK